jgi:superfamily II DNA helicase RecQ
MRIRLQPDLLIPVRFWLCSNYVGIVEIRSILRQSFGFDDFRPAQRQVIDLVMAGKNVLASCDGSGNLSVTNAGPARDGITLVVRR